VNTRRLARRVLSTLMKHNEAMFPQRRDSWYEPSKRSGWLLTVRHGLLGLGVRSRAMKTNIQHQRMRGQTSANKTAADLDWI
jgi:hypothetical protein